METGKTSKYLKYAIGEIILVVIGILIALQINNWNDQKKNKETESLYYCRILDDFKLDKQLTTELEVKANSRIEASKEILLDMDSGTRNKDYILNKFLVAVRSDAYVPRNMAFKDLVSSGNLKLIRDIKIKNSLIQYYSDLENWQSHLKQNRDEKIDESFKLFNSSIGYGMQKLDYVKQHLSIEIMQILPNEDWASNKNSEGYKKLQEFLVFNIAMSDREIQLLNAINDLMEEPYQLLEQKCREKDD